MVVPPAKPPLKNDDISFLRFTRSSTLRLDGNDNDQCMMGDMALLYQSINMKFNAAAPACRTTLGVLPLQKAIAPCVSYTERATCRAEPPGTSPALDVAAHEDEEPEDETRSCISNFTRSIGATAVLANAPAAAPAKASRIEARTNEFRRSLRMLVDERWK